MRKSWHLGTMTLGELLRHMQTRHAPDPLYQTKLGKAYCADSLEFMRAMPGG